MIIHMILFNSISYRKQHFKASLKKLYSLVYSH